MQDVSELMNGPFYYSFVWLVIGLLFMAGAIAVILFIVTGLLSILVFRSVNKKD